MNINRGDRFLNHRRFSVLRFIAISLILLAKNSLCLSADFNGVWILNEEQTRSLGFRGDSWDIASNQEIVPVVKSLKMEIADDTITVSLSDDGAPKKGVVKMLFRSESQLVIQSSIDTKRVNLLTLLSDKTMIAESGNAMFRLYFKRE